MKSGYLNPGFIGEITGYRLSRSLGSITFPSSINSNLFIVNLSESQEEIESDSFIFKSLCQILDNLTELRFDI